MQRNGCTTYLYPYSLLSRESRVMYDDWFHPAHSLAIYHVVMALISPILILYLKMQIFYRHVQGARLFQSSDLGPVDI